MSNASRASALAGPVDGRAGRLSAVGIQFLGRRILAGEDAGAVQGKALRRGQEGAQEPPAVRDRLKNLGADPFPVTSAQFDAVVKKEIENNSAGCEGREHPGGVSRSRVPDEQARQRER